MGQGNEGSRADRSLGMRQVQEVNHNQGENMRLVLILPNGDEVEATNLTLETLETALAVLKRMAERYLPQDPTKESASEFKPA